MPHYLIVLGTCLRLQVLRERTHSKREICLCCGCIHRGRSADWRLYQRLYRTDPRFYAVKYSSRAQLSLPGNNDSKCSTELPLGIQGGSKKFPTGEYALSLQPVV